VDGTPDLADYGDIIDPATFEQILEMDDDKDREFSKGIVYGFFDQAESTFVKMEKALLVPLPCRFHKRAGLVCLHAPITPDSRHPIKWGASFDLGCSLEHLWSTPKTFNHNRRANDNSFADPLKTSASFPNSVTSSRVRQRPSDLPRSKMPVRRYNTLVPARTRPAPSKNQTRPPPWRTSSRP